MIRNGLRALAAALTVGVGGCAGVPAFDIAGPPTVAQIIDKIQCEVLEAAYNHPRLRTENWTAVADLFLQVDDSVGVAPTLSFINPFTTPGEKFTFGASASLKGERQRIYAEKLDVPVNAIRKRACPPPQDRFDLTGNLGIVETVDLGLGSVGRDDVVRFSSEKAFGQTIQFVVTRNVSGVGPTWTLVRFVGGALFGAERIDTHKLIISFAPGVTVVATKKDGVTTRAVRVPTSDKARELNRDMQLQSLPIFRR